MVDWSLTTLVEVRLLSSWCVLNGIMQLLPGDTVVESTQSEMARKLAERSLVTIHWDSEEPKLLGEL